MEPQQATLDDFTTDSVAPAAPPAEAVEAAPDTLSQEPPIEGATEPAREPEPAADGTPAQAAEADPAARGDRNPDGTFKAKPKAREEYDRARSLTWQAREAERERDALRAEVERLRAQSPRPAGATPTAGPSAPPEDQEPREEDFANYVDFMRAQARYEARQELRAFQRATLDHSRSVAAQQRQQARLAGYAERMTAVVTTQPQFLDRIAPEVLSLTPTSQLDAEAGERRTALSDLAEEMLDSPHVAALMSHFSEHPDDLRRFSGIREPKMLLREFAKLEARLETAPTGSGPSAPAISQAKPPIKPVGSAPPSNDPTLGDDSSFDDHLRDYSKRTRSPLPKRRV